jgi:hypothetical protein
MEALSGFERKIPSGNGRRRDQSRHISHRVLIMSYRISGLSPSRFEHLFGLDDQALASLGVSRRLVTPGEGVPDRIELRDARAGEHVLLLNYMHQPANTAYQSRHAIFIVEHAAQAADVVDSVPAVMTSRLISLRSFDAAHEMISADVAHGSELEPLIIQQLAHPQVAYLHAHYAKPGCYAALIERA